MGQQTETGLKSLVDKFNSYFICLLESINSRMKDRGGEPYKTSPALRSVILYNAGFATLGNSLAIEYFDPTQPFENVVSVLVTNVVSQLLAELVKRYSPPPLKVESYFSIERTK